ncbi:MAG: hrp1 1 [Verrucomicrobia bacterium]|jgi:CBS domain-containing protein|nr:hrp1 1 [Verrucomicrobiota bacterium]
MQIQGTLDVLLNNKKTAVWSISPHATVYEAIQTMADHNVGSVLVMRDGALLGVLTERDYTRKVILRGRQSRQTLVEEIMTTPVVTAPINASVDDVMRVMSEKRIRHVPVVEDGVIVGVVSLGDLIKWVIAAQDSTISQLESYITGSYA